ncbi:MAG: hypothetical protein WAZ60_07190, partial [Desulfosalsimonadaceae bacterium]
MTFLVILRIEKPLGCENELPLDTPLSEGNPGPTRKQVANPFFIRIHSERLRLLDSAATAPDNEHWNPKCKNRTDDHADNVHQLMKSLKGFLMLVERSRYAAEKSKMVYTPRICPISGIYKKGVYIMIPTEVNRF